MARVGCGDTPTGEFVGSGVAGSGHLEGRSTMNHRKDRKRRADAKAAVRRGVATGGTVTLATLGLSNCNNGGGTGVDPPPPPPLVCADANQGQNLHGGGVVQDSSLTVTLFSPGPIDVDTLHVADVVGARLDSLNAAYPIRLHFTLDADTTSRVTFTLEGTFDLVAGPCDFTRAFVVTIDSGSVVVTQRQRNLPLGLGRDIRIELVGRDGLRINLRATGAGKLTPVWRVTAGTFERRDDTAIVWQLPAKPGFYQVEMYVDQGRDGFGFDTLSFEVS